MKLKEAVEHIEKLFFSLDGITKRDAVALATIVVSTEKQERDTEAKHRRAEEQGCEWCERDEDGQMRLIWECGLDHFDFDLNVCPNCGRKLAVRAWNRRAGQNPKPLTLNELREMEGEPVWVVCEQCLYNGAAWCLMDCTGNEFELITVPGKGFHFLVAAFAEYYGKTWLAYRTKPEGSGE